MAEAAVELRVILDAAERAASAQDFASAEHYLRQAAAIQEVQLGPVHPDLGNTLNNLGIVFERVGKPADAEVSYRRAYAIVTATLADDDPIVLTSRQNLTDFCAAMGKPFEVAPAAAAPVAATSSPTPIAPVAATRRAPVFQSAHSDISIAAADATSSSRSSPVPTAPVRATRRAPVSQAARSNISTAAAAAVRSSVGEAPDPIESGRRYIRWIGLGIAVLAMLTWWSSRTDDDRTTPASPTVAAAPGADGSAPRVEPERAREETAAPRNNLSPRAGETAPRGAQLAHEHPEDERHEDSPTGSATLTTRPSRSAMEMSATEASSGSCVTSTRVVLRVRLMPRSSSTM